MFNVDYEDVINDAGPENLEYEDYDSHDDEFTKKLPDDLGLSIDSLLYFSGVKC